MEFHMKAELTTLIHVFDPLFAGNGGGVSSLRVLLISFKSVTEPRLPSFCHDNKETIPVHSLLFGPRSLGNGYTNPGKTSGKDPRLLF